MTRRAALALASWLVCVAALAACGDGGGGTDAGEERDGGEVRDGEVRDGGDLRDARVDDAGPECTSGDDCESGVCGDDGTCADPVCDDGVMNGDETDVDCGGATCTARCDLLGACAADTDCGAGFCDEGVCRLGVGDSCTDDAECDTGTCGDFGGVRVCTTDCVDACPGPDLACFEGLCTPRTYCIDPDGDGFGRGPGCAGSECDACASTATCAEQSGGTFECICNDGYDGDGRTCSDVDECTAGIDDCAADATCANTDGAFTCACNAGYAGDGVTCTDVDECTAGTDDCSADAACTNTTGAFTCACNAGYAGDGRTCSDVDECTAGTDDCSSNATCANTAGSFTCACSAGYAGDGVTCTDVNECTAGTDDCSASAACTNTAGGFTCACDTGYSGDGRTCTDVDECTAGTDDCSANAACTNTAGGFTCACDTGFSGDGRTCTDVNECTAGTDDCSANAACTNTAGGFTCACDTGYSGDGRTCADVDECAAGSDDCAATATCTNTTGSFTCACPADASGGDGRTCTYYASCAALLVARPGTPSGDYRIDTGTGGPQLVHCDMTTDGAVGYTMVRYTDASLGTSQDAYRAFCAARGMEVIVPRTRAHALAIQAWNGGDLPNLVNVFPRTDGAIGLANWVGRCGGVDCSFWISNTNNSDYLGFEPNGDNDTANALYRVDVGGDYGRWNDAGGLVDFTGSVICSTNDASPAPASSCLEALTTDRVFNTAETGGISGVYDLVMDGAQQRAYCEQVADGGGWTLVLKADGANPTFRYDSTLWTGGGTLNPTSAGLDTTEALLQGYHSVSMTSGARLVVNTGGTVRTAVIGATGSSLHDVIAPGAYRATGIGRAGWLALVAGSTLQPSCNREGFNAAHPSDPNPGWARARIGIIGNQEGDCFSPDSRVGIGTAGNACGMNDSISVGSSARCSASGGDADRVSFGYVFVR